jgi:tryptophan-rich sensory protein
MVFAGAASAANLAAEGIDAPMRAITEPGATLTLRLWFVQLGLNLLWSVLFFGLRRPDLALIEILLLWLVLVVLQFRLARLDRPAALLWAPYLAWVSFATFLNFTLWRLN